MNEAARGLTGVAEQSLAQGQRIDRQCQTINQGVPAVGLAAVNRRKIALHEAVVTQRAEALELALADAAARGSKVLEDGFAGELLVERDQLAQFIVRGVEKGALNDGQLDGR